ncbi:MAG: hypothetical protein JST52_00355 [Bacteroidetes bacterium]|nr:hypothetical protein [Bacteroidota bacterium]MBS1739509.1 hypothetical protein [Bacteroidota bacterium]
MKGFSRFFKNDSTYMIRLLLQQYLPLIFVIVLFVIFKVPHLFLPHYWDRYIVL